MNKSLTVLENASVGDVDALALVRDDNDGTTEGDVAAKVNVTSDSQVIKLDNLGDLLEALLELLDLLEVVTELDDGRCLEHALRTDRELAMLERVDVRLDEQQVRAALDGQEARPRHVDAMRVLEVLDGGTGRGLELQDGLAIVGDLRVDDDIELHALGAHDALEGLQVDPQVVRVEDLELADLTDR